MSDKNNKIAKQAASVKHDKSDLANHPYLKHSQDKFGKRRRYLKEKHDLLKENRLERLLATGWGAY